MKICIVGNGAGVLTNQNGKFIDSCDLVVRMKNFVLEGFEKNVGSKTDIYSSKWFSWFEPKTNKPLNFNFIDNVKTLMFMFPNNDDQKLNASKYTYLYQELQLKNELPNNCTGWIDHEHLLKQFNLLNKEIIYFSLEDVEELCIKILKINQTNYEFVHKGKKQILEPTCGIRTIFKLLKRYPNEEIFLTGFDGFQTSWYWNPKHKINLSHYYLTERLFLNSLKKSKRVAFLD